MPSFHMYTTIMRRIYPFLMTAMILLAACSKKSDDAGEENKYYLRFKVDGNSVTYSEKDQSRNTDYTTLANTVFSNGNYMHVITGSIDKQSLISQKNFLSLSLLTSKDINSGISFSSNSATSENYLQSIAFALGYTDEDGKTYVSFGEDAEDLVFQQSGITINTDNKITFTEVADTYVRGSFYGSLYADDFTTKKVITEGEFYLRYIK